MINYGNMLKQHDLKVTPQRMAIVDGLYTKGHLTIDELYKILVDKFSSISLATVYKNLNSMMEKSFIEEVKIPNQKSVYEISKEIHSHLVCKKCGAIEDIKINLDTVENAVNKDTSFHAEKFDLVISGICKNCK